MKNEVACHILHMYIHMYESVTSDSPVHNIRLTVNAIQ